jgi:iron complex outermembrane receptor protein
MFRTRKLLFGSTMFAGLAASVSVFAQTVTPPQPPTSQNPPAQPTAVQAPAGAPVVTVTGSRIKRATTFSSPTPLTVITKDQSVITGEVNITDILQLSSVANNANQINNEFSLFVGFAGGPGSNTLSLRGLGSTRTLVLLNGERLGPSGVGGLVSVVDLSVLPQSMIDHVEILKDGASSIYGSDAVAGVVNVITKTTENGEDIHVFDSTPEHPGGASWEVDGSVGRTFDRGYITAGFDYYAQQRLSYAQRDYLSCQRDLVRDATTRAPADIIDPATGKPKCFNEFLTPGVEDFANGHLFAGAPLSPGGPGVPPGWVRVGRHIAGNVAFNKAQIGLEPYNPPEFNEFNDAISALSRYTFTLFGGFDITPHNQMYGSVLLNQRDSEQQSSSQFFIVVVDPGNPFNPGFNLPVPVIPEVQPQAQTVYYARGVLGFKGDLPPFATLHDWTYDIYGQVSRSDGWYSAVYEKNDRVNATAGASFGTNGCDVNAFVPFTGSGQTMAQAEPGVACVPVDYFRAAQTGNFTPQEAAFLFTNERGHTTYDQDYLEGTITGNLFNLWAGPLGAALGFHVRREAINDTPGPDFIARNVYNQSTTGVTKGTENVQEVFGELQIPVLKDLPLFKSLDVNVSGRVSNYSSFGTDGTYKLNFDWKLTDWFAVRGSYGTAFRAPDLFELFLGNQVGFLNQVGVDPCILYGSSGVNATVQKNCASLGIPPDFAGAQSGLTVLTGGGVAAHLKPETARTDTIGVVFTPNLWNMNLQVAADYYTFDIKNQIQSFGAPNILLQCFQSTSFPNNPFCSLFTRADASQQFAILTVNNDFVNVARQLDQGLDLSINSTTPLPYDNKLTVTSELAWTFYTNTILLGGSINNFLGQFSQPEFVGIADARIDHGPWAFNWALHMVGPVSDYKFISDVAPNFRNTGQNVVYANAAYGFYTTSDIGIQRKFDKFTVIAGVRNVFNKAPPLYSNTGFQNRFGTTALATQYDIIGRAFFIDIDAHF